MDKRERLEKTIAGEATDRAPVALWRHWPGDDQRAADLARSVVEFQQTYDGFIADASQLLRSRSWRRMNGGQS
jgi:hypothetical protein